MRIQVRFIEGGLALCVLGLGVWLSGVVDAPPPSTKWIVLALGLHAVPAFAYFLRRVLWLRVAGVWLGIFLLAQALLTSAIVDPNYKTLPPHLIRNLRIAPDAIVGVHGVQTITTDQKGFRVTKAVDYAAHPGTRIIAIGGSTTEQIVLDDRATWTHLLQERLDQDLGGTVEVVNTGVSGLRAVHHLSTLRTIEPYHPDLVLIMVGVNDWNKQIREHFNDRAYRQPLRFIDTLLGKALALAWTLLDPRAEPAQLAVFDGSYYTGRINSLAKADRRSFMPSEVDPNYRVSLEAIAKRCREGSYKCAFLTQPNAYAEDVAPALKERFWMTPPDEPWTVDHESMRHIADLYNRTLIAIGCSTGIPVIDIAAGRPATFESFFDDVHFNESGAMQIATLLAPPVLSLLKADKRDALSASGVAACSGTLPGTNPIHTAQ